MTMPALARTHHFARTLLRPASAAVAPSSSSACSLASAPAPRAVSIAHPAALPRGFSSAFTSGTASSSRPLLRPYSTAPTPRSHADPCHAKGLFFHPLGSSTPSETHYAVSLLSTPPSSPSSPSIMAFLAVPPASSEDPAGFARENPDRVVTNPAFWSLLHEVLKEDIVRKGADDVLTQEAELREDGWAHIADERQPLMPGRIPTPDAILSTIAFTEGKLQPDSYEVNDTYRPITREEGWTVLRDVWLSALEKRLRAVGV